GVVVVEAALRSGSLITARRAAEQGREVFAVPGSPLDPRCRGANSLIREGATLVESADDVIEGLLPQLQRPAHRATSVPAEPPLPAGDEPDEARAMILELLGPTPLEIDELVRQSGLTAPVVVTILLELEVAGRL